MMGCIMVSRSYAYFIKAELECYCMFFRGEVCSYLGLKKSMICHRGPDSGIFYDRKYVFGLLYMSERKILEWEQVICDKMHCLHPFPFCSQTTLVVVGITMTTSLSPSSSVSTILIIVCPSAMILIYGKQNILAVTNVSFDVL